MDITLKDVNGDGSQYEIADTDLSTLSGTLVTDSNYKATTGHIVKLDFGSLPAIDYDPVAQAAAIQAQIDALQAQLGPLQAVANKMTPPQQLKV